MRRSLATILAALALTGCGADVDLARQKPPLVPIVTTTSVPVTTTTRPADWPAFTRYVTSLRAWWEPSQPATLRMARPSPRPSAAPTPPVQTGDYTTWPDWPVWECTYRHESGGHWDFVGGRGGMFRGAFAIYIGTYRQFAPAWALAMYASPQLAPPGDQIRLARAIHSRIGHTQWGGLAKCIAITSMSPMSS